MEKNCDDCNHSYNQDELEQCKICNKSICIACKVAHIYHRHEPEDFYFKS